MSGFSVDASGDSIESCLRNVESSDVVVCILDRRYGRPLGGRFGEISATECQVRHARTLNPQKPVLFFARNAAFADFQQHKSNAAFVPKWVDSKPDNFERWCRFFEYVAKLPEHASRSNWFDQFQTAVDLKPVLMKRLAEKFASRLASRALDPNRVVRLTYRFGSSISIQVEGAFVNIGLGPAINVLFGLKFEPGFRDDQIKRHGGLREGDKLLPCFAWKDGSSKATVYCEYENRFRDKYRIEQDVERPSDRNILVTAGPERFFVGRDDGLENTLWVAVE